MFKYLFFIIMIKGFIGFVFEVIKVVLISSAIVATMRYFLIQPFYVKGASMEPNFHDREYLIVDEISYRFKKPKRGDVIVFRYPKNPQEYFIKRVIGLPGEKVEIKDGKVFIYNDEYIDGVELDEKYLPEHLRTYGGFTKDVVEVKGGEYFVLGDNRNASKDSRSFGAVKKSFLIGRVLFRSWPFDKVTIFKTPEYQY